MEFNFTFKKNITKEYIFSKVSQETIFAHYLNFPINSKKLYCSQLRDDKCPTCSVYKSKSGILYYKDFATNQTLNCIDYVKELHKCDYHKALEIIAKDFGLEDGESIKPNIQVAPTIKKKTITKIQCEIKEFSKEELNWWNSFGISIKQLKKFNIFSIKHVFIDGVLKNVSSYKNPIYGYYGGTEDGVEYWRIYFPMRDNYRFLSNWPSKKIQGLKQLPNSSNLLVITKSMKDCACLAEFNIPAIAPCSETLFINDNLLEKLKKRFKNIVVLYDSDRAGKYNLAKIRRQHPELTYFIIPKEYNAKDISDFRKMYGYKKTEEFIKKYLKLWLENLRS